MPLQGGFCSGDALDHDQRRTLDDADLSRKEPVGHVPTRVVTTPEPKNQKGQAYVSIVRKLEELASGSNFDITVRHVGDKDFLAVRPKGCQKPVLLHLEFYDWSGGGQFIIVKHRSPALTEKHSGKAVSIRWVKGFLAANKEKSQKAIDRRRAREIKAIEKERERRNSEESLNELRDFCTRASDAILDKLASGESVGFSPQREIVTEFEEQVLESERARRILRAANLNSFQKAMNCSVGSPDRIDSDEIRTSDTTEGFNNEEQRKRFEKAKFEQAARLEKLRIYEQLAREGLKAEEKESPRLSNNIGTSRRHEIDYNGSLEG